MGKMGGDKAKSGAVKQLADNGSGSHEGSRPRGTMSLVCTRWVFIAPEWRLTHDVGDGDLADGEHLLHVTFGHAGRRSTASTTRLARGIPVVNQTAQRLGHCRPCVIHFVEHGPQGSRRRIFVSGEDIRKGRRSAEKIALGRFTAFGMQDG